MKNTDNIEKLFKKTLEHFEADVNPQLWSTIQSGINSVSGSAASAADKFAIGKMITQIVIGTASVAVIAGSVWYFSSSDNKTDSSPSLANTQHQVESFSNPDKSEQNIISENKPAKALSNAQTEKEITYSVHSFNKNSSAHFPQTQIVSGNADTSGTSVSENTTTISTQPEQHKYGRSSNGPTSLIRGNQRQKPKSKPSKDNSASISQDAEQTAGATMEAGTESGDAPEVKAISGIVNTPNVFSPNGDEVNDFFFFELKNIASIEVVISDRQGGFIYKWNNLNGNWNGKLMNGNDAPEGLYLYAIQAIGTDGVSHSPKGTVTLSRKHVE